MNLETLALQEGMSSSTTVEISMNLETLALQDGMSSSTTVEISMNLETLSTIRPNIQIYDSRNFNELGNLEKLLTWRLLSTTVEISMNLETAHRGASEHYLRQ